MLAAIGALATVWLVGAAGQRQEVLALRNDVPYGQQLSATDLLVVRVSMDPGVSTVPASSAPDLVGQRAASDLIRGSLLVEGQWEPAGDPRQGWVVVPVAVPGARMPAGGLRPGDQVLVVDPEAPAAPPIATRVVRVGERDLNGVSVVDVTTMASNGSMLTALAALGRIALVVAPVSDT